MAVLATVTGPVVLMPLKFCALPVPAGRTMTLPAPLTPLPSTAVTFSVPALMLTAPLKLGDAA